MASDRPIFIFGCPRSGTTLLQLMLHAHPRIAIPPETRFLLPAYRRRDSFGDLSQARNRAALADWITRRPETRFSDLGLDPVATREKIVGGPPTIGSAVGIVLRSYADKFGKARWGDKRPGYWSHVDTLARLFPDAQFVHIVRDGRDCVASLKRMPWWRKGSMHAIATWMQAIDAGRRAAWSLPPGSYYELQYERLVADPYTELSPLCAFLGEDCEASMMEPFKVAGMAVPGYKTWHSTTRGEISTSRSGGWRDTLDPWEVSLCESVMGTRLRSYGYELSGAPRPAAKHLASYARVAVGRRLAARKREAADLCRRQREPGPVAAFLTSGQLGPVRVPVQPGPPATERIRVI